ncbi:MAG: hypothetical protein QOE92_2314 [Chloroflexota bacterium]|nr:hypothetical protein [Chloroflexota bacterium]
MGLFLVLVFLSSGIDRSEGSIHYFLTQQILQRQRLSFDSKPAGISVQAPNGRYYLMHEAGNSLWLLPTAAVAEGVGGLVNAVRGGFSADRLARLLITFNAAAYVALACLAVFVVAVHGFDVTPRVAIVGAVMLALGSEMLAYAQNLFDGVAVAAALTGALAAAVLARRRPSDRLAAVAGMLAGMAVITRLTAVLAVPALAVYLLVAPGGRRRVAWFLATLAPFAGWQAYYNNLRTGSSLVSAEMLPVAHNLTGSVADGLAGLLLSPSRSVLVYTPLLVLLPLGALLAWRVNRPLVLAIGWILATYTLFIASLADWAGAYGWGPRHMVVVVPVAFILVVVVLGRARSAPAWVGLAALAVMGTVVNLPAILANWHYRLLLWMSQHGGANFPDWSVGDSQWVFQLRGLAANLRYVLGQGPPAVVPEYTPSQAVSANTADLWWLTASQFGVPAAVGVIVGVLLVATGVTLVVMAWRRAPAMAPAAPVAA